MKLTLEQRLLKFLKPNSVTGCLEFTGYRTREGYGQMGVGSGKLDYAHRIAWKLWMGTIPNGLFVLHKCDNPACSNPQHLFLGTQSDNVNDCKSKGRLPNMGKFGESSSYHKLTKNQVEEIRMTPVRHGVFTSLAKRFGVHKSTIAAVMRGKWWVIK